MDSSRLMAVLFIPSPSKHIAGPIEPSFLLLLSPLLAFSKGNHIRLVKNKVGGYHALAGLMLSQGFFAAKPVLNWLVNLYPAVGKDCDKHTDRFNLIL